MMMPIMEAVLIELEGATSTEVEDKSRTNIRKLLALSVHSVENIVAEVTFQFWEILINFMQFLTVLNNFWQFLDNFGHFFYYCARLPQQPNFPQCAVLILLPSH